jgi:hypothetical protein
VVVVLAVVGVVVPVPPEVVVVVVEPDVVVVEPDVVVVVELFLLCVVVVVLLDAFFEGELDPQAAATSPPARTIVPISHRFPGRLVAVSAPSGLTRLNT